MRNISQHLEIIEKAIEYSPAQEVELAIEQRDAWRATIEGVVYFTDGSRLEFTERVAIEKHRLVKKRYRYQFVRHNSTIFRYDNAPHHPDVMTHPHHKHVGANILPAIEPDFSQVLDEAVALLSEETPYAKPASKKRRPRTSGQS